MKVSRRPKVLPFLLTSLLISTFHAGIAHPQRPAGSVIVLRGATVIDGLGNPPLSDAVLVIEGDEITSISFWRRLRLPCWSHRPGPEREVYYSRPH